MVVRICPSRRWSPSAFGERFGLAQVLQASPKFPELDERIAQLTEQIDAPVQACHAARGDGAGRPRACSKHVDRLPVGRARHGFVPRLPAVGEGLVPQLALEGMVGQPFDRLAPGGRGRAFEGLHDLRVQGPPPLVQQTAVGHLLGEGVLEGVGRLGEEVGLIEELGGLEVPQAAA